MRSTEIPSKTQQARNCISARIPTAATAWSFTAIGLTPNFSKSMIYSVFKSMSGIVSRWLTSICSKLTKEVHNALAFCMFYEKILRKCLYEVHYSVALGAVSTLEF